MKFDIVLEVPNLEEYADSLEEAMACAMNLEGVDAYVCAVLTTGEEVQRLNCEFRGIDRETDVLSFPANELQCNIKKALEQGLEPEMEDGLVALGDIAISVPRAAEQAEEYGNTLLEELRFLCVHGILHLMGYDHECEEDEIIMRQKQREALGRNDRSIASE